MAQAVLNIFGQVTGLPNGSETVALKLSVAGAVGQVQKVNLVLGANTIAVPAGSTLVVIVPPDGNAVSMTLKGVSGDTGIALSLTQPFVLSLASVASFVLTAGGALSGLQLVFI